MHVSDSAYVEHPHFVMSTLRQVGLEREINCCSQVQNYYMWAEPSYSRFGAFLFKDFWRNEHELKGKTIWRAVIANYFYGGFLFQKSLQGTETCPVAFISILLLLGVVVLLYLRGDCGNYTPSFEVN